ncbi:MAG: helix-turn-helix transcriptional regulator [Bacteroidaceae bacterium]|nr:helix-turn-helix transcriptional regulator [Bacteroidaceae bacterium]
MGENTNIVLTEAVYYILLSLMKPLHGYGIMQKVSEMTGNRLIISAGTLYGAINTLLDRGWIKQPIVQEESRRKEYVITDEGRTALVNELERLRELVANGEAILR